jgi:serine/threonine protein phosphatase PrpC
MEDAHICSAALNDDEDMSLFAVFDGHGGFTFPHRVSAEVARPLPRSPSPKSCLLSATFLVPLIPRLASNTGM